MCLASNMQGFSFNRLMVFAAMRAYPKQATTYIDGSFHMKSPDFQKSSHMTLLDFLLILLKCYPYSQTEKSQISGPCVFSFSCGGLGKLRCRDPVFHNKIGLFLKR